jgi:uncharacterized protein YndB with AHSA1/START domain
MAMKESSVVHSTIVIERNYPATPQRVFAAFSDPKKKRQWFSPDDGAQIEEYEMDFRVGGWERKQFRAPQGFVCTNNTVYQDIVPDSRIVMAYTMTAGDARISASLATFELLAVGDGTKLVFTEQAAFFEGADGPEIRRGGWVYLFEQLAKDLAG